MPSVQQSVKLLQSTPPFVNADAVPQKPALEQCCSHLWEIEREAEVTRCNAALLRLDSMVYFIE